MICPFWTLSKVILNFSLLFFLSLYLQLYHDITSKENIFFFFFLFLSLTHTHHSSFSCLRKIKGVSCWLLQSPMIVIIGCSSSPFRHFQLNTNSKLRLSQFVNKQSVAHLTISDQDKSYWHILGVPKLRATRTVFVKIKDISGKRKRNQNSFHLHG